MRDDLASGTVDFASDVGWGVHGGVHQARKPGTNGTPDPLN
jgi:hypothetical protein